MKTWTFQLCFLNPAFLGNADQTGQWRTPPIKALLRQWWRVAYAAEAGFAVDVGAMRTDEGRLFGTAADTGHSNQSRLRIRLDNWNEGKLKSWAGLEAGKVVHPEVERPIGPHLYLAYGPLSYQQRGTVLATDKGQAAIEAGEVSTLRLALMPDTKDASFAPRESRRIDLALALMNRFGTLGGRSRNGWGSFELLPENGTQQLSAVLDPRAVRPWCCAFDRVWPHAIGCDSAEPAAPLIWQTTETFVGWAQAMRRLAEIKIGLRTQFEFPFKGVHAAPLQRHWLSYPVTTHSVDKRVWPKDARLPNSLRFRLRRDADDPTRLRAVIFHVPCRPLAQFTPDLAAIVPVWQAVHGLLDELCKAPPSPRSYVSFFGAGHLAKLKSQLDKIQLQRVPS